MKFYIPIIIVLTLFVFSCEGIFERNIEDSEVMIISPQDNDSIYAINITFWWEQVEDASRYNLQIVQPDFNHIQDLILDTVINKDKFTINLNPGTYSWRIRAENSNSVTEYKTRRITILFTDDLSNEMVILQTPSKNTISNKLKHTFSWQSLPTATQYLFDILDSDDDLVYGTQTDSLQLTYTLSEGEFTWRVRAENPSSVSLYSSRSITIDITPPNKPSLISPGDDSLTTSQTVTFQWDRGSETGTPITDSLFIYSDSLTTLEDVVISFNSMHTQPGLNGTFYWRVRSVDAAGNGSSYSDAWRFTTP